MPSLTLASYDALQKVESVTSQGGGGGGERGYVHYLVVYTTEVNLFGPNMSQFAICKPSCIPWNITWCHSASVYSLESTVGLTIECSVKSLLNSKVFRVKGCVWSLTLIEFWVYGLEFRIF